MSSWNNIEFSFCEKVVCFCATGKLLLLDLLRNQLPRASLSERLALHLQASFLEFELFSFSFFMCRGQRVVDFLSIFRIVMVSVGTQLAAKVAHSWLRAPWMNPGSVANQTL